MPLYRVRSIDRAGVPSICRVIADDAVQAGHRGVPTGNDVESVRRIDDAAICGWSVALPLVGFIAGAIRLANGESASAALLSACFGCAAWGVAAWLAVARFA